MSLLHPEVADHLIAEVFSEELFLQDEFIANHKKSCLWVTVVMNLASSH